jgi:hypothetical protein
MNSLPGAAWCLLAFERFSSLCGVSGFEQGGYALRKKPLAMVPSLYSNWRTARMGMFEPLRAGLGS